MTKPQGDSPSVDTVLGAIRVRVSHGTGPAVLMWPSLLMTGDLWAGAEDATFPVAETRAIADSLPGSSFVVPDGVAHLAALEDPPG